MSVNSSFIAVDWVHLERAPKNDELPGHLFEAIDASEEWLSPVPFGNQVDPYYFESWNGLMAFNDWFREARKHIDPDLVEEFASLYMAVGLLHRDDTYAFDPIRKGFDFSGDWILAAIPPDEVAILAARAKSLDLDRVARDFQTALDHTPCDMLPDGAAVAKWISSLRDGLRATADSGRGIIMGAA